MEGLLRVPWRPHQGEGHLGEGWGPDIERRGRKQQQQEEEAVHPLTWRVSIQGNQSQPSSLLPLLPALTSASSPPCWTPSRNPGKLPPETCALCSSVCRSRCYLFPKDQPELVNRNAPERSPSPFPGPARCPRCPSEGEQPMLVILSHAAQACLTARGTR